jgi:5-oxoprolinase (ATP-hydrolysing)/N-methylhydantoinase A
MAEFDPIELQVLWSRLIHIADECWTTILRAAFSTVIGEALDFGVEILDAGGGSLAHAPRSMPVFHFCLPNTVHHLLEAFPAETLQPGDVLMTNDPWLCAGHLPDIATVSPVFHCGRMVALMASVGNASDIGGTKNNAAARELYEEGILIPPVKAYRAGVPVPEVFNILAANVRLPQMVVGDVQAQIAANLVGADRLSSFLDEYGMRDLAALAAAIQERAEDAMRAALRQVPDGIYTAETEIDGLDEPLTLSVVIEVAGDIAHVDYAQAPIQVPYGGINCPRAYTVSHTLYALKLLLTPDVPSNMGNFRPFSVSVPEGSILAARRPASVALRTRTGWHIHELVYKALAPALPDRVQAGSGLAFLLSASGFDAAGNPFSDHLFLGGGQGASAGHDGISALLFPTSAGNVSIEMFEQRVPLVVEQKSYVEGSGGPGEFRGGLGERVTVRRAADDGAQVALGAFPEGLRAAPPGLVGGRPGAPARIVLDGEALGHGRLIRLETAARRLDVLMPGGGGWGDPECRSQESRRRDETEGYVGPADEPASATGGKA